MILSSHPGQPALSTISGPSVVATPDQLFIIALLKTMTKTKTKTKKHNEKDKDKKTMKIQDYEQLPHLISCLSLPLTIAVVIDGVFSNFVVLLFVSFLSLSLSCFFSNESFRMLISAQDVIYNFFCFHLSRPLKK